MLDIINSSGFWLFYLIIASLFSSFIGYHLPKSNGIIKKTYPAKIIDLFLNFFGCMIGWLALAYFIYFRFRLINTSKLEWEDFIVFLIIFYGITGHLPDVLINKLKLGK